MTAVPLHWGKAKPKHRYLLMETNNPISTHEAGVPQRGHHSENCQIVGSSTEPFSASVFSSIKCDIY
jgi:hypothetical protein